jgi:hypothetical protein
VEQEAVPWHIYQGGHFPKRVALNLAGHVFERGGAGRLPIIKQKSGLFIPREMVEGATAAAFVSTISTVLPARLKHEIGAIIAGHAPR